MESKQILSEMEHKMEHSMETLRKELAGIRTNKASAALLDNIRVEAYGSAVPLNQVATVSAPDARTIHIQPWDKQMIPAIDRAIQKSDLGLTTRSDGASIQVPVPALTEDRRKDYVKIIRKLGEEIKVSVRNVRRDAIDRIKKIEKDGVVSEDESKRHQKTIQDKTDKHINDVDHAIQRKEVDVMEL